MARKAKYQSAITSADKELRNMKYKDLKRACIVRNMPFEEVGGASIPQLQSYFSRNFHHPQDLSLLDAFDNWLDREILAKKYPKESPIRDPRLRMGYVPEMVDGKTVKTKRVKGVGLEKQKKKKRERVEGLKIFSGTKKALTYQCVKDRMTLQSTLVTVKESFEDVSDKSVAIWYKRAAKEMYGDTNWKSVIEAANENRERAKAKKKKVKVKEEEVKPKKKKKKVKGSKA